MDAVTLLGRKAVFGPTYLFRTWALTITLPPPNSLAACLTSLHRQCHSLLEFLSYLSLSAGISGVIQWSGPSLLIYAISEQRYTLPA